MDKDKTINGAFTFKGEHGVYEAGQDFMEFCLALEIKHNIQLVSNRVDYNSPRLTQ